MLHWKWKKRTRSRLTFMPVERNLFLQIHNSTVFCRWDRHKDTQSWNIKHQLLWSTVTRFVIFIFVKKKVHEIKISLTLNKALRVNCCHNATKINSHTHPENNIRFTLIQLSRRKRLLEKGLKEFFC